MLRFVLIPSCTLTLLGAALVPARSLPSGVLLHSNPSMQSLLILSSTFSRLSLPLQLFVRQIMI